MPCRILGDSVNNLGVSASQTETIPNAMQYVLGLGPFFPMQFNLVQSSMMQINALQKVKFVRHWLQEKLVGINPRTCLKRTRQRLREIYREKEGERERAKCTLHLNGLFFIFDHCDNIVFRIPFVLMYMVALHIGLEAK